MLRQWKKVGRRLSLDHHSQGMLLAAALFFVILQAWWSLPGLVLYGIMHFQYGGSGTFQRPPRGEGKEATVADAAFVVLGILGLVLMIAGIAKRMAEVIQ